MRRLPCSMNSDFGVLVVDLSELIIDAMRDEKAI